MTAFAKIKYYGAIQEYSMLKYTTTHGMAISNGISYKNSVLYNTLGFTANSYKTMTGTLERLQFYKFALGYSHFFKLYKKHVVNAGFEIYPSGFNYRRKDNAYIAGYYDETGQKFNLAPTVGYNYFVKKRLAINFSFLLDTRFQYYKKKLAGVIVANTKIFTLVNEISFFPTLQFGFIYKR
jgi:hypothetical protein